MNRTELIEAIYTKSHQSFDDVEFAVKHILMQITETLCDGGRVEIRDFGNFTLKTMPPRQAQNPKTLEKFNAPSRSKIVFKPGKGLQKRLNQAKAQGVTINTKEAEPLDAE